MGINESGRKKLIIGQVFEPKTPEGFNSQVLEFTAKVDPQENAIKHSTWSKALFPYIKPDTTIDCDVEVKPGKADNEGNPRWNRKVTQIYVDGKPVAEKSRGGNFNRSSEDSPEKRRSVERQTALTLAVDWAKFILEHPKNSMPGTLTINPIQVAETFYQWISQGTIPPDKPTSTPSDAPKQGDNAPAGTGQQNEAPDVVSDNPTLTEALKCKTAVDLYNFALKHGKKKADFDLAGLPLKPIDVRDVPAAARALFG